MEESLAAKLTGNSPFCSSNLASLLPVAVSGTEFQGDGAEDVETLTVIARVGQGPQGRSVVLPHSSWPRPVTGSPPGTANL